MASEAREKTQVPKCCAIRVMTWARARSYSSCAPINYAPISVPSKVGALLPNCKPWMRRRCRPLLGVERMGLQGMLLHYYYPFVCTNSQLNDLAGHLS